MEISKLGWISVPEDCLNLSNQCTGADDPDEIPSIMQHYHG